MSLLGPFSGIVCFRNFDSRRGILTQHGEPNSTYLMLRLTFSLFFGHRVFRCFDLRRGILTQHGELNSTYLRVVLSTKLFLHLALRGRFFDSVGSLLGWFWGAPGSFWAAPGALLVQTGTLFPFL